MEATPDVPTPQGHGWILESGKLTPNWFDVSPLPQLLVDMAESQMEEEEESEDENAHQIDLSPTQFYDSDSDDEY